MWLWFLFMFLFASESAGFSYCKCVETRGMTPMRRVRSGPLKPVAGTGKTNRLRQTVPEILRHRNSVWNWIYVLFVAARYVPEPIWTKFKIWSFFSRRISSNKPKQMDQTNANLEDTPMSCMSCDVNDPYLPVWCKVDEALMTWVSLEV